ncbi:MAG: hypothetical protein WBQ78_03245 [Gammaproteobacteria bacterium]
MIRINSFLHRDRLSDVIRRWMRDTLQPGDVDEILRLVHFNNVYVTRCLGRFSADLFAGLHGTALRMETVATKGALRDRISRILPSHCARCAELATAYAGDPGHYFRDTPFHGTLYFHDGQGDACYAGSSRIKRIRRLAEKTARRLVDWLYMGGGTESAGGVWQQEAAPEALQQAEQRLLVLLHDNPAIQLPDGQAINDVAGLKVILETHELERLTSLLQDGGCTLIEQERHDGNYRATNLVVGYHPDKDKVLAEPLHDRMLQVFGAHGYTPGQANAAFREFVQSGEESINLEIIVTSYLEMLESEIGRCMHEERIIRQRHNPRYCGQLAQNVGFLMEFLFTYPALPFPRLDRLPVRIRDRYLPDYFDEVRRKLFNNPSVELNEL